MRKGLIYKYTSKTTKKSYIGKTIEDRFEIRQSEHRTCCKDTKDSHFYRAKQKYGYEDFELEVVEKGIPLEKLDEREAFWIEYYNTFENGYNATRGGDGGNTYAKRTEEQMEETRKKISKALRGSKNGNKGQYVGEKNPMYGKRPHNAREYVLENTQTKERQMFTSQKQICIFLKKGSVTVNRLVNDSKIVVDNWKIIDEGVETIESID